MEVTIRSCMNGYSVVWRGFKADGTCNVERRKIYHDLPSVLFALVYEFPETHDPILDGDLGEFAWFNSAGDNVYRVHIP